MKQDNGQWRNTARVNPDINDGPWVTTLWDAGSPVVTDVPPPWGTLVLGLHAETVLSAQIFCQSRKALKNKLSQDDSQWLPVVFGINRCCYDQRGQGVGPSDATSLVRGALSVPNAHPHFRSAPRAPAQGSFLCPPDRLCVPQLPPL